MPVFAVIVPVTKNFSLLLQKNLKRIFGISSEEDEIFMKIMNFDTIFTVLHPNFFFRKIFFNLMLLSLLELLLEVGQVVAAQI